MTEERIVYGCREVDAEEKARLVSGTFDAIARTYDRANSLFSLGIDGLWRRKGIRLLDLEPGERVLDVCGGTGALARLAAKHIAPGGRAVVFDINAAMLEVGRKRSRPAGHSPEESVSAGSWRGRGDSREIRQSPAGAVISWVRGDAERLAFPDGEFDAVTLGFGLRNIVHLEAAFRETTRVLKPGGRFLAIDFGRPRNPVVRAVYGLYSSRLMPSAARRLFGNGEPYRYLAESVRLFQTPERTVEMLEEAGLGNARFLRLTAGIALVFLAEKPSRK